MPSSVTEGERKRRNNTKRILGEKVACTDEMYERVTEVRLNLKISLFYDLVSNGEIFEYIGDFVQYFMV